MDSKRHVTNREPVQARCLEVTPRKDESPEVMIRRFCKKVRNEGIFQELYQRRGYEKPSQKRRRKAARARFNAVVAARNSERN